MAGSRSPKGPGEDHGEAHPCRLNAVSYASKRGGPKGRRRHGWDSGQAGTQPPYFQHP